MVVAKKSKILIIGATGYIGRYLVEASIRLNHPTFVFVREATAAADLEKANLIEAFQNSGVTVFYGDLHDHESLVNAVKHVEVVFSAMGHDPAKQLADQINIIAAIKEAGTIKRYFPSEFGFDVDRLQALEPAKGTLAIKVKIRQAIREAGIPFTFVSNNFCATYFLSTLGQVEADGLPESKVIILGDGNTTVIFVDERDIATYAIKAADDPQTLNKVLYIRPAANIYSLNELVSLYEKKTKKILERIYVPEQEVIKKIQDKKTTEMKGIEEFLIAHNLKIKSAIIRPLHDSPGPLAFIYAVAHASFIKGEQTNYEIDESVGIEATSLYPEVKYTTVNQWLNNFMQFAP